MKTNQNMLLIFLFTILLSSCTANIPFIEVSGSAEMEIEPDEIHLKIVYGEYYTEQYESRIKKEYWVNLVNLDSIEPFVLQELERLGVKKEQMTVTDNYSYDWFYYTNSYLRSKKIVIKLRDFNLSDKILSNLKVRGIKSAYVSFSTHKDITQFRKQVKIAAVKAAKEKAIYMMESLGQSVGDVLFIKEGGSSNYYSRDYAGFGASNTILSSSYDSDDNDVRSGYGKVEPIKLKYEVQAKFEVE